MIFPFKIIIQIKILLFLLISFEGVSQSLDFKTVIDTISKAINSGDAELIGNFSPSMDLVTFDYEDPQFESEQVLKGEFVNRLSIFFENNLPEKFRYLDVKEKQLPMAVGKYETNEEDFYFLMMFSKYNEEFGFVMFHIVPDLPESMQYLDK